LLLFLLGGVAVKADEAEAVGVLAEKAEDEAEEEADDAVWTEETRRPSGKMSSMASCSPRVRSISLIQRYRSNAETGEQRLNETSQSNRACRRYSKKISVRWSVVSLNFLGGSLGMRMGEDEKKMERGGEG